MNLLEERPARRRGKHRPWTDGSERVLIEHIRKRIARERRRAAEESRNDLDRAA